MKVAFPALCPNSRNYQPGSFPTKRFTSVSGAGTTRLYGSQPFNAQIRFEFLVTDPELESVFECYTDAKGDFYEIKLPREVFAGMSKSLFLKNLEWRWANPPKVTSVIKGRSRLTAEFVAVLEAS